MEGNRGDRGHEKKAYDSNHSSEPQALTNDNVLKQIILAFRAIMPWIARIINVGITLLSNLHGYRKIQ